MQQHRYRKSAVLYPRIPKPILFVSTVDEVQCISALISEMSPSSSLKAKPELFFLSFFAIQNTIVLSLVINDLLRLCIHNTIFKKTSVLEKKLQLNLQKLGSGYSKNTKIQFSLSISKLDS